MNEANIRDLKIIETTKLEVVCKSKKEETAYTIFLLIGFHSTLRFSTYDT